MANKINSTSLDNLVERVQLAIEKREDFFNQKSEKWQYSEKSQEYEDKTYKLQEVLDYLESAQLDLEKFNNM